MWGTFDIFSHATKETVSSSKCFIKGERGRGRKREGEREVNLLIHFQILPTARAGPGESKEPGTLCLPHG